MSDPVRSKLVMAIGEAEAVVSVRQISARVREPKRKVRYHLDVLAEQGVAEIARTEKRRGVMERFYRLSMDNVISDAEYEAIDDDQGKRISLNILRAILGDASAAAAAGMFGTPTGHATLRVPGEVDCQGWKELSALYERTLSEAQVIIAKAGERLSGGDEEPIATVAALLLFEVPRWPE